MSASPLFPGLPAGWREEELHFQNDSLFMRLWSSGKTSTGRALFLVHGFGEQSGRYMHFPHYLRGSVDAIGAIDLPGHGKSAGIRGHCENFDQIRDAAIAGFEFLRSRLSAQGQSVQMHWMGHSMGGLTSLKVAEVGANLPVKSMILSAPLLALSMPVPPLKAFFGKLIEPLMPRLKLANEIDGARVSRDPSVVEEYRRDPLNHAQITPRMFQQMTGAMDEIVYWAGPLPYSTMLILSLGDQIVDARVTLRKWQEWPLVAGLRRELTMWPGAYHESCNDIIKEPVFNAIDAWLRKF